MCITPLVITVYGGRAYHGLQGDSDTLPLTHPVTLSFLWVSPLQPRASADVVPSAWSPYSLDSPLAHFPTLIIHHHLWEAFPDCPPPITVLLPSGFFFIVLLPPEVLHACLLICLLSSTMALLEVETLSRSFLYPQDSACLAHSRCSVYTHLLDKWACTSQTCWSTVLRAWRLSLCE